MRMVGRLVPVRICTLVCLTKTLDCNRVGGLGTGGVSPILSRPWDVGINKHL